MEEYIHLKMYRYYLKRCLFKVTEIIIVRMLLDLKQVYKYYIIILFTVTNFDRNLQIHIQ